MSWLTSTSYRIATEELDKAIADHGRWLESAGRSGKRLNLGGYILNGRNLSGLDLRAAIFKGTQLSWVNFSESNLSEADLCGAAMNHSILVNTNFTHANLSGANLHCADMTGVELADAILLYTDMRGAICHIEPRPEPAPVTEIMPASAALHLGRKPVEEYNDSVINRLRKMVLTYSELLVTSGRSAAKAAVVETGIHFKAPATKIS